MQAEAAEIVGHPSGSYLIRVLADQRSPLIPQIAIAEPRRQNAKRHQRTPESLNLRVAERQGRSSLLVNLNRTIHALKGGFGQHIQSWLTFWTSSRRRLTWKPTSRRADRLGSRLPM